MFLVTVMRHYCLCFCSVILLFGFLFFCPLSFRQFSFSVHHYLKINPTNHFQQRKTAFLPLLNFVGWDGVVMDQVL